MERFKEILKEYEDNNEMHFHDLDKKNVIYPAVKKYVEECAKASLIEAGKNAKMLQINGETVDCIDQISIIDAKNIVLL